MSTTTAQVPALTTTFTPAASCLVSYYQFLYTGSGFECENDASSLIECVYMQLGPSSSTSPCLPSSFVPKSSFYYSPGICPSGYELACSSTSGEETRGTCCPSSFSCLTDSTSWPWYSTDLCTYYMPSTLTFVYEATTVGVGWVTSTSTGGAANAFGIPIRYRAGDFASITSSKSASTATSTSTSITSQSAVTSNSIGGLSTAAKVGIGVSIAVAAIIFFGALIFFLRFRRRRSLMEKLSETPSTVEMEQPSNPFLGSEEQWPTWEMADTSIPAELNVHPE